MAGSQDIDLCPLAECMVAIPFPSGKSIILSLGLIQQGV